MSQSSLFLHIGIFLITVPIVMRIFLAFFDPDSWLSTVLYIFCIILFFAALWYLCGYIVDSFETKV